MHSWPQRYPVLARLCLLLFACANTVGSAMLYQDTNNSPWGLSWLFGIMLTALLGLGGMALYLHRRVEHCNTYHANQ